mgnify:CR=1 FL=1
MKNLKKKNIKNFANQKIIIEPYIFKEIDKRCIKNFKIYDLYKIFPYPFEKINLIKQNINYISATGSNTINPFFYGETTISNIAKRYPVNYFFKTLMLILSTCLFFYWRKLNKILNLLENNKNTELFYFFGLLSAISLLFHILFLGIIFENQFLNKIRSSFIIFFILFEISAQIILTIKLNKIKKNILSFLNLNILKIKIIYVAIIIPASLFAIYIITKLENKFENMVEWNFFLYLLFFYILTFMIVKKNHISIHPPPKTL